MELTGGAFDYGLAFLAGIASFLSPCVLPLVPGYLAFVTGMTPGDLEDPGRSTRAVLVPSLLFVLGFSIVFVALGASASAIGSALLEHLPTIQRVLGVVVILMGVLLLGIVKVPWLYGEARFDMGRTKSLGRGAAVVTGMAFAFGWTPCVGPILALILSMSMSTADVVRGALLLAFFSAGLGVPLLAVGLLYGRLRSTLGWLNRHAMTVSRIAGAVLIGLGVLIVLDRLSTLAAWLQRVLPVIEPPL